MQAQHLGQDDGGGDALGTLQFGDGEGFHLGVGGLLLVGQLDVVAQVHLLRQVVALGEADAKGMRIHAPLQILQVLEADDDVDHAPAGAVGLCLDDSVGLLEGGVFRKAEQVRIEELELGIEIEGRLRRRQA